MKILLTGKSGQIGGELAVSLQGLGEIVYFPREQMDLSDLDQIRDVIRAVAPDLIVNPAAYTAVVKAESEPALAMLINGEAPGVIAQEAQRLGAAMIHYSTDYVFDGTQTQPYTETAPTNPINVYGRTKLAGELAVARYCEAHWILRTSWVYNVQGANFMKTVIRLAQEQPEFSMTCDQFGAPNWARSIAKTTAAMLSESRGNVSHALSLLRESTGIYHLSAVGETSWHEYAAFIVDHLRARGVPTKIVSGAAIQPVPTATGPDLPERPKSSRLAIGKIESTFKLHLPNWRSDAVKCLNEIIDNSPALRASMQQLPDQ